MRPNCVALIATVAIMCGPVFFPSAAQASHMPGLYRLERRLSGLTDAGSVDRPNAFATPGWYFVVEGETKDSLYIKFLRHPPRKSYRSAEGEVRKNAIYGVEREGFEQQPLNHVFVEGWYLGVLAVPFKYRLKTSSAPGQLAGSATLGGSFGYTFTLPGFGRQDPQAFVGLSQIALNDLNGAAPNEVSGISYGVAYILETARNAQLGAVLGWDLVSGSAGTAWPYQNRAWISLSINYAFLGQPQSAGPGETH